METTKMLLNSPVSLYVSSVCSEYSFVSYNGCIIIIIIIMTNDSAFNVYLTYLDDCFGFENKLGMVGMDEFLNCKTKKVRNFFLFVERLFDKTNF